MIIDKDAKIFGKINIIDLCIVIALIAAAAFVVSRQGASVAPAAANNEYIVKFYVEEVEDFTADSMKVGDHVYDDSKDLYMGAITNIERAPSIEFNPDADGNLVKGSKEGYSSMEITSELKAQGSENGIIISGNRYSVGHGMTIRAGSGKIYLRMSGIEEKGAGN